MKEDKKKCNDENCECGCKNGEECKCDHEHDHDCDCSHEHCDCNHEPTAEDYQRAFDQFEQALIKVDADLKKAKQDAEENQRIAVAYKKDLERFKERNKNIEIDAKNSAIENVAMQIIPVIDQFEQALGVTKDSNEKKGFEMIYLHLTRIVQGLGITEINALGQPFDSNLHSAVSKTKVKKKEKDGIVTAVYQKGYKLNYNDKIIRYATVEVGEYTK